MNNISRTITGGLIGIFAIFLIVTGITDTFGINYPAILGGVFLLILGLYIVFNKKEDEIEEIKKSK